MDKSYLNIYLRVNGDDMTPLEPLSFEHPIYTTIVHDDDDTTLNVLRPKLKSPNQKVNKPSSSSSSLEIVFSLFNSETRDALPFLIDARTGEINLNLNECNAEMFTSERVYTFGIKATYKKLLRVKEVHEEEEEEEVKAKEESFYYFHDYMIPAFAKVQISFKHKPIKTPLVHAEILASSTSLVKEYREEEEEEEERNVDANNRTFIFCINQISFNLNTRLVKLHIENKLDLMDWAFDQNDTFVFTRESDGGLTLRNGLLFKDEQVYKVSLNVVSKGRLKMRRQTILTRINLEFRVDFNPLVFEKREYTVNLTPRHLLGQELIKIGVRKASTSKMTNVSFTLARQGVNGDDYFEINQKSGWLMMTKQALNLTKSLYEITVIATANSVDLKKKWSSRVHVQIKIECSDVSSEPPSHVKFSIFDNFLNGTRIGALQSVCSNRDYLYELSQNEADVKICEKRRKSVVKNSKENCEKFSLDMSRLNGDTNLIMHDRNNGYLMTNRVILINLT
jgi:hypothetical protein